MKPLIIACALFLSACSPNAGFAVGNAASAVIRTATAEERRCEAIAGGWIDEGLAARMAPCPQ